MTVMSVPSSSRARATGTSAAGTTYPSVKTFHLKNTNFSLSNASSGRPAATQADFKQGLMAEWPTISRGFTNP